MDRVLHFNSSKVRLKVAVDALGAGQGGNFNSSKVRLKALILIVV